MNALGGTDEMEASSRREIAKREIFLAGHGTSAQEQQRRKAFHDVIINEPLLAGPFRLVRGIGKLRHGAGSAGLRVQ
jgi:hypothetical protein